MASDSLVAVFTGTVAPVLVVAGVGYLLGTVRDVAVEPLNTVALYVLLPALVFHSLVTGAVGGATTTKLVAGFLGFTLVMLAVAAAVGRAVGESGDTLSALVLASAFPNAGNFGIPVATFAFGGIGRNAAVLFVAVQNVLMYTLGVYVASSGGVRDNVSAVKRVFSLPLVYAVAIALAVRWFDVAPAAGSTAMETLGMVGNASIPLFLLILGLTLADSDGASAVGRVSPALALKLVAAPVLGAVVALAIGFADPTVARAFVLLCAGPSAVMSVVLMVEFAGEADPADGVTGPEYASTVIFATLLAAVPLVTALVTLLKSGAVV